MTKNQEKTGFPPNKKYTNSTNNTVMINLILYS